MKKILDINYKIDNNPCHFADFYLPDSENFDTIIYIHGGGLERGSRKNFKYAEYFTKKNIAVVSVDYSLFPEAEFPDFINDVACAVVFIKEKITEFGGNGKFFLWGSSAGAYITMMLCLNDEYFSSVGLSRDCISGYISESAQQFAHFNVLKYKDIDKRLEITDETAPIHYLKDGLSIQPLLMMYYSDDMVCRPEENKLMYKSLKRFIPEDAPLEISEITGKHCRPENPDILCGKISSFVKSNF